MKILNVSSVFTVDILFQIPLPFLIKHSAGVVLTRHVKVLLIIPIGVPNRCLNSNFLFVGYSLTERILKTGETFEFSFFFDYRPSWINEFKMVKFN